MAFSKTDNDDQDMDAFFAKHLPAPATTECPHKYFHKQIIYQAAYKNSDPNRFVLAPEKATAKAKGKRCPPKRGPIPDAATQTRVQKLWKAYKQAHPRKRQPKKKTTLQILLDEVGAAFKSAFPDGVSAPFTEEKGRAIDEALAALNSFYEEAGPATKSKPKPSRAA
ncbi:hypothetical protein MSAN_00831400 [Mycena sanguinolenta]|uniref:Uncharacterized protein n=1 Tax=Mycena sanguinolenta TaxID=230812 RepID=A0A8H7DCC6_9AGAR|nr:hypothetical protein MSAN_00831400 [Mycena sanguinolenta]